MNEITKTLHKNQLIMLESSGIIDAYEYVITKLCGIGMPTANCYEMSAFYLLEYEKLIKEDNPRIKSLQNLIEIESKNASEGFDIELVNKTDSMPITNDQKINSNQSSIKENKLLLSNIRPSVDIPLKSKLLLSKEEAIYHDKQKILKEEHNSKKAINKKESLKTFIVKEDKKLQNILITTMPSMTKFELEPIETIRKFSSEEKEEL